MTKSEIFIWPGRKVVAFLLEVMGWQHQPMDEQFFNLLAFIFALFTWIAGWRVVTAIVLRLSGFDRRPRQ